MMQVRDSAGRKVSLLNDDAASSYPQPYSPYQPPQRLSYTTASHVVSQPYSQSMARSGSSSPLTPQLLRSDSYDSQASNEPLSPITPNVMFAEYSHGGTPTMIYSPDGRTPPEDYQQELHSHAHAHVSAGSKRPSVFPIPSSRRSMSYDDDMATSPSATAPSASDRTAKRYPCRYRETHNCDKTFTTSGHASRHSKIHTAEKAVLCTHPGCTKKFTRADNMKQHLETHYKDKGRASSASRPSASAARRPSSYGKHGSASSGTSSGINSSRHSASGSRSHHSRVDSSTTPLPSPGMAGSAWDMRSLTGPLTSRPYSNRTLSGLDTLAMAVACQEGGA